jgi:GST-like protein
LYLADLAKSNKLVPSPDDPTRAEFLRWLIFLVASLYPTFAFGDVPARFVADPQAAQAYKTKVGEYRETMWRMVEGAARAPWFLGDRFSAIDLYIVAMTYWFPRREWFAAHAPKLTKIATTTEGAPKLAEIWKRNFLR